MASVVIHITQDEEVLMWVDVRNTDRGYLGDKDGTKRMNTIISSAWEFL
jgi:hypothetical protein